LRKTGRAVKLEKIPMDLLVLLVGSEGRLVTREEIEEQLWGKGVFVDAEHGINTAIRKVRQALGDDPEEPKFVQTVQKKGYRFIAQVKRIELKPTRIEETSKDGVKAKAGNLVGDAPEVRKEKRAEHVVKGNWLKNKTLVLAGVAVLALLAWPAVKFLAPKMTSANRKAATIRSIAVLPLENISGDKEQEFFADGMTDELITMLAKYPTLRVISRTSVMQYKKAQKPLPEIARELGVDGIIEGSVSRGQGRVRVRVQLIYAPTDTHLWAESYDRDLGDVLALQEELARNVAGHVSSTASSGERTAGVSRPPVNPAARDAYYRGRIYWFSENYVKSREFFEEAVRLDPSYSAAYSGLADSFAASAAIGRMPAKEAMPQAEKFAKKALDLDDTLAEAHNTQAAIKLFFHWDWEGARKESEKAVELNASLAEAHHLHAYTLTTMGRMDESVAEDKRAMELDPFARPWAYGYAFIRARRYDEALQELQQKLEARPDSGIARWLLADVYFYKGDTKNAVQELKNMLIREGNEKTASEIDSAYRKGGYAAIFQLFLDGDQRKAKKEYVSPLRLAGHAVRAGKREEALSYLEEACEQRDPFIVMLQHDPQFDPLHSDPRYLALVKKVGLPGGE
jgi:TolB-like protein/DNA-binding winged helix-turn-helix (wHTH) protein